MREPYALSVFEAVRKNELSVKGMLGELRYWYVKRQTRKFIPWLARKLPTKLKYFVVIHGMVTVEPNFSPTNVTGMQMLELWKKGVE